MNPVKRLREPGVWPWLLVALTLIASSGLLLLLLRKTERDALAQLQDEMLSSAQAVAELASAPLAEGRADAIWRELVATQNATGSRVRLLDKNHNLVADSLEIPFDRQASVRFRPEIEQAYQGRWAAYTRLSDETERALALYMAVPVYHADEIVGVAYLSHSTDGILQRLGALRASARDGLMAVTFLVFLVAAYLSGTLRRSVKNLRNLALRVADEPEEIEVEGGGEIATIGEGINRLVQSLKEKVAQLEDEKAKTRSFMEDVAHELKTPVTGLCGSVDALMSGADGEARERLLRNLERESARLSSLISRLIELQKLDYYELKLERFELVSLLETACDNYEQEARKKQIDLALVGPEELEVTGDADKLQHVIENLLDNAIRVSPVGSRLELAVEDCEEGVRVALRDEGPGLAQGDLFERHRRTGSNSRLGNLGLGLAIASEVIRRHGHELGARGREGGGTEFFFTLTRVGSRE